MNFSIIIPAYNSGPYLQQCLEGILKLNFDQEKCEIIVVDGGSTDNTLQMLKNYPVTICHSPNFSISQSRNIGAEQASNDIFVFVDSDCILHPDIFIKSKKYLDQFVGYGALSFLPPPKSGWIAKTWLLIAQKDEGPSDWLPSGTLIVKKTAFNEISGFNERLKTGEDYDFCLRLNSLGYRFYNDPSISSIHLGQTDTIIEFFKKEMWRGKTLLKGLKEHGFIRKELPSTIVTFYYLVFLLSCLASVVGADLTFFLITLVCLLIPSVLQAIKFIRDTGRYDYAHKFFGLGFIYQVARAFSILRFNQLRDLF